VRVHLFIRDEAFYYFGWEWLSHQRAASLPL